MNVIYKDFNILSRNQVESLYKDAGWSRYTQDIEKLIYGIQNSDFVYSAWHENELIALVRLISDDYTICYIQDILVKKAYHHQGIAKTMLETIFEKYKHVYQIVLLTDEEGPHEFYQKMGFSQVSKNKCRAYIRIKKE